MVTDRSEAIQPASNEDCFVAPLIGRIHRNLPAGVDLHGALGLFLLVVDLSRPTGTLTLSALERVAGCLDHIRAYIETLKYSGLISIKYSLDFSCETCVISICDRQFLDVWWQAMTAHDYDRS